MAKKRLKVFPSPAAVHALRAALTDFPGGARAFAGKVGVHESIVCHWRAGRRTPPAKYRAKIKRLTGIAPDDWGPVTTYGPAMFRSFPVKES